MQILLNQILDLQKSETLINPNNCRMVYYLNNFLNQEKSIIKKYQKMQFLAVEMADYKFITLACIWTIKG